jgi:hypothetical protein
MEPSGGCDDLGWGRDRLLSHHWRSCLTPANGTTVLAKELAVQGDMQDSGPFAASAARSGQTLTRKALASTDRLSPVVSDHVR